MDDEDAVLVGISYAPSMEEADRLSSLNVAPSTAARTMQKSFMRRCVSDTNLGALTQAREEDDVLVDGGDFGDIVDTLGLGGGEAGVPWFLGGEMGDLDYLIGGADGDLKRDAATNFARPGGVPPFVSAASVSPDLTTFSSAPPPVPAAQRMPTSSAASHNSYGGPMPPATYGMVAGYYGRNTSTLLPSSSGAPPVTAHNMYGHGLPPPGAPPGAHYHNQTSQQ